MFNFNTVIKLQCWDFIVFFCKVEKDLIWELSKRWCNVAMPLSFQEFMDRSRMYKRTKSKGIQIWESLLCQDLLDSNVFQYWYVTSAVGGRCWWDLDFLLDLAKTSFQSDTLIMSTSIRGQFLWEELCHQYLSDSGLQLCVRLLGLVDQDLPSVYA